MELKRFQASDMKSALRQVKETLGASAIILYNHNTPHGVEVGAVAEQPPVHSMVQTPPAPQPQHIHVQPQVQPHIQPQQQPAFVMPTPAPTPIAAAAAMMMAAPAPSLETVQPAVAARAPAGDHFFDQMQSELKTLRAMVENQLSGFAWNSYQQRNPQQAIIVRRLTELGLHMDLCRTFADQISDQADIETNWQDTLTRMGQAIQVTSDDILTEGGVVALVGPTGVGKTTTLAKLAARFTQRYSASEIAILTTDSYRIAAFEQCKIFGQILGVSVRLVETISQMEHALYDLKDKRLVLIDTMGLNQRDVSMMEQLSQLTKLSARVKPYLVLSGTSQYSVLAECVRAFTKISVVGAIVTKVDETTSLGEVLSILLKEKIPVAYIANGQRVPEDLRIARGHYLIDSAVALTQRSTNEIAEEQLAYAF